MNKSYDGLKECHRRMLLKKAQKKTGPAAGSLHMQWCSKAHAQRPVRHVLYHCRCTA